MSLNSSVLEILFLSAFIAGIFGNKECLSPQYFERGTTGTINCAFNNDFYGIFWYNTTRFTQVESILSYVESVKSGSGLLSGEYDIHPNGSLIIRNVSLGHEITFTVLKLDTFAERHPSYYTINVIVTVTPETSYPVVDGCRYHKHQTPCVFQDLEGTKLTCTVAQVRPRLRLEWELLNGSSSVTLYNQQYTSGVDGDTFNITATSLYRVVGPLMETVAVACNAFHEDVIRFNRSTMVVLKMVDEQPTDGYGQEETPQQPTTQQPTTQQTLIIILCISIAIFVLVFGMIAILKVYCKRRKSMRNKDLQKHGTEVPEEIDMPGPSYAKANM